jgi:hypothetical protein
MTNAKNLEWWSKQVEALSRTKVFEDTAALRAHLDATRTEMFGTLSAFHSQVQGIAYFAAAVLGLSVATVAFAVEKSASEPQTRQNLLLIAVSLLMATVPLGWVAIRNMRERYRSYVSTVVYAAQVHAAAKILSHPWLEWVSQYLQEGQPRNNQELVNYWINTPPNSFISYRRTIIVVQFLAVLGALFIIGFMLK